MFDKEKYATTMKEDDIKFSSSLQSLSSLSLNADISAVQAV